MRETITNGLLLYPYLRPTLSLFYTKLFYQGVQDSTFSAAKPIHINCGVVVTTCYWCNLKADGELRLVMSLRIACQLKQCFSDEADALMGQSRESWEMLIFTFFQAGIFKLLPRLGNSKALKEFKYFC